MTFLLISGWVLLVIANIFTYLGKKKRIQKYLKISMVLNIIAVTIFITRLILMFMGVK